MPSLQPPHTTRVQPAPFPTRPPVLRHMARIGDFREAFLTPELVAQHGAEDKLSNVRWGGKWAPSWMGGGLGTAREEGLGQRRTS